MPGNHDMTGSGPPGYTRDASLYNHYFGSDRFAGQPWYGGYFGNNESNYCFFSAGDLDFMVLSLEFLPRDETLTWANSVIQANPDRRVIVATHKYLNVDGTRATATEYDGIIGNNGNQIFDKLVKNNENVFMVVCGHVGPEALNVAFNTAGKPVYEILSDYQTLTNGGNGWLRTLQFRPDTNQIAVESYSPTLDLHNLYGEYTLTYDMGGNTGVSGVCWINEVLTNPNGSDSNTTGNEHFELRGTPGMSLTGYYLLSVEGGDPTGRGDINQFFDLGAFSIGENGYLFARQNLSLYTATATGATVIQNTAGQGWGLTGSTVGYSGDGTQVDLENGTTTIMLINIESGIAPDLAMDLDADNDGLLDALPTGWSIVDSVGIIDGAATQAATDWSYGAITLRVGGTAAGSSQYGNIVDVPGAPPTDAGAFTWDASEIPPGRPRLIGLGRS